MELEYVDYASATLSDRNFSEAPYSFDTENSQVENIYRSVVNARLGAEARITPQFYLRGGLAFYASPYKEGKGNEQNNTMFYTGGLGYNWGDVYLDASCVLRNTTETYYAYDPTMNGSRADFDFRSTQIKFTLGLRF